MTERRVYPRIDSSLFVRYQIPGTVINWSSFTKDISLGGLKILSRERLLPDTKLDLSIDIPEAGDYFYGEGEVRWISDHAIEDELGNEVYMLGIMLNFSDTYDQEYLKNYIEQYI